MDQMSFQNYNHIHFIGIGGIGISALAFWALKEGKTVTGSDASESALIEDLRNQGAAIEIGHKTEHVPEGCDLAVFTEAIDKTNPEYLKAKKMGIPVLSYFQALGQISMTYKTIAVIGTHGKTTTTAMLGLSLISAGLDPTVIVGSKVREFGGRNIRLGHSDLFVLEACEYRRSFMSLNPFGVILLNCEADHLDYYKNEESYVKAFEEFVEKIPEEGFLVVNRDDVNAWRAAQQCKGRVVSVEKGEGKSFDANLSIMGEFNRLNALFSWRAAEALKADWKPVKKALEDFRGTWRRMEYKGVFQGAPVYDDYGHHPTEVLATLEAIRAAHPAKRLVCVFQPHQFSRTYQLLDGFKTAFGPADRVIIPNIYAARDTAEDKKKISAESLVKAIGTQHSFVEWGKDFENTLKILRREVKPTDVVVTMGAGNITELADQLIRPI